MITFGSDVGDIILQRTLSENTQGLSLAIERMTSGYKVNHAKDNAAGYSIITDLNTKISSMLQVQQNTEDGIAMLQTAEGGLEEIQGLLERLRALAQQASNGSYGADERESMQAEADEIIAEIARIRDTIQYNGMNLYETPRNEDIVTTSLNRLSASANITNAGEIYPKKTNNDTQSSPVAFTLAVGGGVNTLASSSSVSLLSNDTIEGAVDLGATETKTINIDGVEYTIRNRNATANAISYTKDTVTGELTFLGSDFTIRVQSDVAHNVSINGSRNYFSGGDLNCTYESIKQLEAKIEEQTPARVKNLCKITGIETLTASIFYTETKGKRMSKAQFANYCGVAPVECSSGLTTRFRNNKRGNRTLNSLLYSISISQARYDDMGSAYFQKKLAEGKSKKHARKCLARQVANIIWKGLFID